MRARFQGRALRWYQRHFWAHNLRSSTPAGCHAGGRKPARSASNMRADGQASWGHTQSQEALPLRLTPLYAVLFALLFAAPSTAAVSHTVQPGETLWSIAAANNLTTRTVAAFNGLSESSQVVLGSTIQVPSTVEGYAALQSAGLVSSAPAATAATPAAAPAPAASSAPKPLGGYTVRPGDTLSGLAASSGVSLSNMATMNGLDPNGV